MTTIQKSKIAEMRGMGDSYAKIAAAIGISANTIKSHCRRRVAADNGVCGRDTGVNCEQCQSPLVHTPGAKKKRFCSDKCRMAWWNARPEAVNRKATYQFKCAACDTAFESYGNAHRKYCSRECSVAARRVSDG